MFGVPIGRGVPTDVWLPTAVEVTGAALRVPDCVKGADVIGTTVVVGFNALVNALCEAATEVESADKADSVKAS